MMNMRHNCSSILGAISLLLFVVGSSVLTRAALGDENIVPVCSAPSECTSQHDGQCYGGCGTWNVCYCECSFADDGQGPCTCYLIPESC